MHTKSPEERLNHLETSLRRLRLACGALGMALVGTFAMAAAPASPKVITASELILKEGEYTLHLRPNELEMTGRKDAVLRLTATGLHARQGSLDDGSGLPPVPLREVTVSVGDENGASVDVAGRGADLKKHVSANIGISKGRPSVIVAGPAKMRWLDEHGVGP